MVESQPSKLLVAGPIPVARSKDIGKRSTWQSMFEQAVLPVQDQKTFAEIESALQEAFAPAHAAKFLRRLEKARLRARQFEAILAHGFLGAKTPSLYGSLGDSDRGQVRELYLGLVEHVAPELRTKYLKVYAYY